MLRIMKNSTECERRAVMLDEEVSNSVAILQRVAQGCTLSPINIQCTWYLVCINDVIVAVQAEKQGVTVGEYTVLGLMLVNYFVGTS